MPGVRDNSTENSPESEHRANKGNQNHDVALLSGLVLINGHEEGSQNNYKHNVHENPHSKHLALDFVLVERNGFIDTKTKDQK